MAALRYEISLRVLFFQHEKRNFVSPSDYGLCSHSNGDIFTCEDIKFSRESSPGI